MAKNLNITLLYDFYKDILTKKQAQCIDLYYNEDLSLAEMSENLNITRQGARDNIKRGEAALASIEQKLKLAEKFMNIKLKLDKIDEITGEIQKSPNIYTLSNDIKIKINEIIILITEINN